MALRIVITGDRNWDDYEYIYGVLSDLPEDTEILHGDCRGVDKLAERAAKELFTIPPKAFPADWDTHGPSAGPKRNRAMLDEQPDEVLAFHDNIYRSKGTKDCLNEAKRRGINFILYDHFGMNPSIQAQQYPLFGMETEENSE
jgi:hypothetical protein